MDTYIIERRVKSNGGAKTFYHQSLAINQNKSVMNVYIESITSIKKEALRFYDKAEAEGMAVLMSRDVQEGEGSEVITIKG
jgi:hypothetical protein